MKPSFLSIARAAILIVVCGVGVASTSRGMRSHPVEPYYVQLAHVADKTIQHTKQQITGDLYARDIAK